MTTERRTYCATRRILCFALVRGVLCCRQDAALARELAAARDEDEVDLDTAARGVGDAPLNPDPVARPIRRAKSRSPLGIEFGFNEDVLEPAPVLSLAELLGR